MLKYIVCIDNDKLLTKTVTTSENIYILDKLDDTILPVIDIKNVDDINVIVKELIYDHVIFINIDDKELNCKLIEICFENSINYVSYVEFTGIEFKSFDFLVNYKHKKHLVIKKEASVAIVGNSPHIIDKGHGAKIDSHDIVVRFNAGGYKSNCESCDFGKRTTFRVINTGLINYICDNSTEMLEKRLISDVLILSKEDLAIKVLQKFPESNIYMKDFNHQKIIKCCPQDMIDDLRYRGKYSINPTSGMIYTFVFLSYSDNLTIFGINIDEEPWSYSSVGTLGLHETDGIFIGGIQMIDIDIPNENKREYVYYDHMVMKELENIGKLKII